MFNTAKDVLVISIGAIFGANARWIISRYLAKVIGPVFPYGTLVINIVGSFIVGFFMVWATERVLLDPRWRLLVVVGFCGALTTFSTVQVQLLQLLDAGRDGVAAGYVVASLAAGYAGVLLATALVRRTRVVV